MGRKKKSRRQSHGSAWHWKQTDSSYFTLSGTNKQVALCDEDGERIRGASNKEAAELALAKEELTWEEEADSLGSSNGQWLIARVCSEYIQYCQRGVANGSISKSHRDNTVSWLNDLCSYCGAMRVADAPRDEREPSADDRCACPRVVRRTVHARRSMLKKTHMEPPLYQQIADRVMVLYKQGMLLGDIAKQIGCDHNTITAAVRWRTER